MSPPVDLSTRFPLRFPVKDGAKHASTKGWNTLKIENQHTFPLSGSTPTGYGLQSGIRNNISVVDVDNHGKAGKNGLPAGVPGVNWFKKHFGEELKNTFCVETPSGGLHL